MNRLLRADEPFVLIGASGMIPDLSLVTLRKFAVLIQEAVISRRDESGCGNRVRKTFDQFEDLYKQHIDDPGILICAFLIKQTSICFHSASKILFHLRHDEISILDLFRGLIFICDKHIIIVRRIANDYDNN